MQKSFLFYILIFLVASLSLSAILPYPIFSSYTNITTQDAYHINNYRETELVNDFTITPQILDLKFDDTNQILDTNLEIIDIFSHQILLAYRIGGNNHIDIIFEKESLEAFQDLCHQWSWSRRPVLVKLSENAYLPASIICYPHGYNNHFCLHFKGSKTHGTNKVDEQSQKIIDKAKTLGITLLSEN